MDKEAAKLIAKAQLRGDAIFEAVSLNGHTTLDISPRKSQLVQSVSRSFNCKIFQLNPDGTKHVVFAKRNGVVLLNAINLAIGEAA